jgi:DNA-binding transcriptional LysR family regulator
MENLDFAEIAAFLKVVDAGSYTKAAESLSASKSSISRRVAQLEKRLGVPLLHRSTRSLSLTEEGTAFHARVSRAMAEVSRAAQHVHDLQGAPRGHLRVTAPGDMGNILGPMFVQFTRQYPEVTVEVTCTQLAVDLVTEGYDIALRAGPLRDSAMMSRRVGGGRPRLYASPAYLQEKGTPRVPADLHTHECVLFANAELRQRWPLDGPEGTESIDVEGRLCTNSFSMMVDILNSDGGIGVLPPQFSAPQVLAGNLACVLPDFTVGSGQLHLVYPGGRHLSARVRVFRDFALEWLTRAEAETPTCELTEESPTP